jgi:glucose-6-phosphate dehydrogenase assembly protein OpcA
MTTALQSLTDGEPRTASVADLESELLALSRPTAEDAAAREGVTRACALTLQVYVESEEAGREVSSLVSELTLQNPCRAIVIIAEPDGAPAGLAAWISAHCHLPTASEKQVCCEQVSIRARGEAVQALDNVVLPLRVPGLPAYLWWRAGHFAPPAYIQQILGVSNRVLVDSARFSDPESDLPNLAQQIAKFSGEPAFSDLNWARITPCRELLAQCFDSAETRPYLDRLTEFRIEYDSDPAGAAAHRAQSLLLTGWMASRLNWEPVSEPGKPAGEKRPLLFRSGKRMVEVVRVSRPVHGACGCLSVEMKAGGSSPATFSLRPASDGKSTLTCQEIPGRPPIERAVRVELLNEVGLVNEEIKFQGRDRVYNDALDMVARMLMPAS